MDRAQITPGSGQWTRARDHLRRLALIAALLVVVAALPPSAAAGRSNLVVVVYDVNTATCTTTIPRRVDFGSWATGSSKTLQFCVTNVGTGTIDVTPSIGPTPPFYCEAIYGCNVLTLGPGQTDYEAFRFSSADAGRFHGTFRLDATDGSSWRVGLVGVAFVP